MATIFAVAVLNIKSTSIELKESLTCISNNLTLLKQSMPLVVLIKLAKSPVVRFDYFLFVLYKPNSLIGYLTL
jgi:hypothetical protein